MQPYKVLVWGDSIAVQTSPNWPSMTQASMDVSFFPGRKVEFINIGQCGLAGVYGQHLFEEKVKPVKPDLVIIEFGFNDLRCDEAHNGKAIGEPDDFEAAMRSMIRNAKSIGADVLVLGIHNYSFGALRRHPSGLTSDQTTELYRERARMAANAEGADYINMADVLAGQGLTPREYTMDGCHLSLDGNRVYSCTVSNYLLKKIIKDF